MVNPNAPLSQLLVSVAPSGSTTRNVYGLGLIYQDTDGHFHPAHRSPNPKHLLLPGMFVRAVVQEGIAEQAIMVPQQGVSRTPKGDPYALIVDENGKAQQRMLSLNCAIGDQWLVSSGLSAGDRVIVEGMMNIRPGATVKAVAWEGSKAGAAAADRNLRPPNRTDGEV